ncbi:TAT-variant-translocated molybdopterin oxidoreductase [Ignavibacteria bacterium]|nr:4Fe-4S dicluster domain-containing protein [Bacteroidota bacterium]MCZ2131679.1 4Fe-4S dicluster domain-containing protein [Bacteroidota bacterium]
MSSSVPSRKKYFKSSETFLSPETAVASNTGEFDSPPLQDDKPLFESAVSRRSFMAVLSGAMAFAAAGCRRPDHKLVPYVKSVEYQIPGIPNYYTTVFQHKNAAYGLLVKSSDGHPTKIDGNDLHPMSNGKVSAFAQATLMNLYDPDRMRRATVNNGDSTLENALTHIKDAAQAAIQADKSVRILIDEHCSPTFAKLISEVETKFPKIKFVVLPSIYADGTAEAMMKSTGFDGEILPNLSAADVILSVDSDFLGTDKFAVYHTVNFARNRKPEADKPTMSKLLAAESALSLTGSNADKRILLKPNETDDFIFGVLKEVLAVKGADAVGAEVQSHIAVAKSSHNAKLAAEELLKAGEKAVVMVGPHRSVAANAAGFAINMALGCVGAGKIIDPVMAIPNSMSKRPGIATLRDELKEGNVDVVIYAGVNPEYTADRELKALLTKVHKRFSWSLYKDETALTASVNIPTAHFIESWGDAIAPGGVITIQQPIIAPVNSASVPTADLVLKFTQLLDTSFLPDFTSYYDYLRAGYTSYFPNQQTWEKALSDGMISAAPAATPVAIAYSAPGMAQALGMKDKNTPSDIVCFVTPSYSLGDGTYANNSWLLELADPITKMTWDNVALMNATTAAKIGVKKGEVVIVSGKQGAVEVPAFIQPGVADGVVAVALGYGRTAAGQVANGVGDSAYKFFGAGESVGYYAVSIEKTGKTSVLATTQNHHTIDDEREVVKETTLAELAANKAGGNGTVKLPISLVDDYTYKGHRWAMTIDLSACTGCNSCVIACQSENNIPNVGKQDTSNGRGMHWLRIDRYFSRTAEGDENVEVSFQPMFCQHCENAPCENVCPVAATTHSPEGLNEMTYNRCVGTKYCLNNCPYKVRRFNWFNYHKKHVEPANMLYNPDVTMRMRGVMEKCTFCVQRINHGKYHAKDQGRSRVKDGEVTTACQQACPAGAIIFGDVNDKTSKVVESRKTVRGYRVLEELNVRPSVTYLEKVRNREAKAESAAHHG